MTKCDFCTKSSSDGKCYCDFQFIREDNCKKAIDRMVKAMATIIKILREVNHLDDIYKLFRKTKKIRNT